MTTDGHTCVYTDGWCRLPGIHDGVPDPDPWLARLEDFSVRASRDGDTSIVCAHYARGCWWEVDFGREDDKTKPGDTLGELIAAAKAHLAESHAPTVDGSVVPTV